MNRIISRDSIVLAQANSLPGDVEGNAIKAAKWIKCADRLGAGAIVFPELFLVSYPTGNYMERFPVVVEENLEWLKALASITTETKVIMGFINKTLQGKNIRSCAAVLAEGKVQKIIGDGDNTVEIAGKMAGIVIGENFELTKNVDYLINLSASITRTSKESYKHNMLSGIAKKHNMPLVYVNQVGANDAYSFDGASRVYGANGELVARAKSFQEQFFIVNPFHDKGKIYPLPNGLEKFEPQKGFSLDYESDLERTYLTIIQSVKEYFKKTGFKRAVLGLSGGLDSAVCAVLLADDVPLIHPDIDTRHCHASHLLYIVYILYTIFFTLSTLL